MSGLLVRPSPMPGESRQGYLVRITEANALASPSRLSAELLRSCGLGSMLEGLRGPIAGLRALNAADAGGLGMRYWNVRACRYCPACLGERAVWRDVWQLVFYVACHRHNLALRQSCPRCSQLVAWKRESLVRCRCGGDLREADHQRAAPKALAMSRDVAAAWGQESLGNVEGRRQAEPLLHRIWLLGAYRLALQPKAQKLSDVHLLPQALRVVLAAADVLDRWPGGFHALLDATSARYGVRNSARMTDRFGGLYKEIYASSRAEAFTDLREGFEQYVRERWSGQLAGRNTRLSETTREAHAWVPITQAARELRWRGPHVRAAVERGQLQGRLRLRPSGRIEGVVHRASLDLLKTEIGTWMDLGAVCKRLRKGKKAVKQMVATCRLAPVAGPSVDGGSVWQFRAQDVEHRADDEAHGGL